MREIIKDRVILARDGFMVKTLSRVSTGLRVPFVTAVLPKPTIKHCQWDHGDGTSRALLAWQYLHDMVGETPVGAEMEAGLWQHLKSLVVPQTGMVCVPDHSDMSHGKYYYHMWDQGRYFDYLVQKYQHPSTSVGQKIEIADRVRKFQEGIYALAVPFELEGGHIGLKWNADTYWNDSPGLPSDRDYGKYNFQNWCIVSSQLLGPQTQWAIITGDENDIDKAIQLAYGFIAGLESPRRESTKPTFTDTGAFKGHVHGTLSGLVGILKLAKYLLNGKYNSLAEEWIDLSCRVYTWLFDSKQNQQIASSCGCVPEGMQLPRYSTNSEICCTADALELAAELAECASINKKWDRLADLWDDVERFSCNELLNNQFTDIAKVKKWLSEFSDQSKEESFRILEKLIGTWISSRTYLNELGVYCNNRSDPDFQMPVSDDGVSSTQIPMLESGGCCAYSGVRGLYVGFMKAVVQDGKTTEIRIPASHEDANIRMVQLPGGAITFSAHRDCQLRFRKPSYTTKQSIHLEGGGPEVNWSDDDRWLSWNLQTGNTGTITWEQTVWTSSEIYGPPNDTGLFLGKYLDERIEFKLSYKGNVLTKVEPAGKNLPYEKGL